METRQDDVFRFKPFYFRIEESLNGPEPRSGHRIVSDGKGNIYCYGGYYPTLLHVDGSDDQVSESLPLFKQVWKYNIARGRWVKLKVFDIPDELVSCFLFIRRNSLYVFGGTGYPFGAVSSNSVHTCQLSCEEMRFKEMQVQGERPASQYGQGCVIDNNILYTVGGTNGYDYSCDVHKLNLDTGTWESLYICTGRTNEPFGRYRHEVALDGEKLYLIGGGTIDINASLDNIPVFHITTKKWELVKTEGDATYGFPAARKYHSSVKLPGNKFLIIGGYDGENVFQDIWILDITRLSWQFISNSALPTYFNSSTLTECGKVYTFGGVHHANNIPQRTSIMLSAWLGVPTLKHICWDALKYYNFIKNYHKTELLSLGVPHSLVTLID